MHLMLTLLALGCSGEPTAEAPADDPCPNIALDDMTGNWMKYQGGALDHTHRFSISKSGADHELVYVPGSFEKVLMRGKTRVNDVMFTETVTGDRKARFERGEIQVTRLFVEPQHNSCNLRVSVAKVQMNGSESKETVEPGFQEYIAPPTEPTFTYGRCDAELFLGDAASDFKLGEKQLSELGMADPNHALGEAVPVGMFSTAEKDGDAGCTYDMDLYFDDRPAKGRDAPVPAGEVKDGKRHWYVPDWYAPYSGNHHFEIYRHRTCNGGERELIGTACISAVLM